MVVSKTMGGGVFISYRRGDTAGYAGRLYDRLKSRFPERVFMDVGEIAPGTDFVTAINAKLDDCKVMLALIGREWTAPRLDNSADFVRLEIATALTRGVRVIPVLLGGAVMPSEAELPANLTALSRRQALEIGDSAWDFGCQKLIGIIEQELGLVKRRNSAWKLWAAGAVVVTAGVIVARVSWLTLPKVQDSTSLPNCLAGIWKEQYDNPLTWKFTVIGDSLSIERTDHFASAVLTRSTNSYTGDLKWGNGTTTKNVVLTPTSDCARVDSNQGWWYHK